MKGVTWLVWLEMSRTKKKNTSVLYKKYIRALLILG